MLSFRNAKTVNLYVNCRVSENQAFIHKSEYYNNYYGNRTENTPQIIIIRGYYYQPIPATDKVQNVHVPYKTYNHKLLHFIKTNALTKTYDNKVYVNADLAKII